MEFEIFDDPLFLNKRSVLLNSFEWTKFDRMIMPFEIINRIIRTLSSNNHDSFWSPNLELFGLEGISYILMSQTDLYTFPLDTTDKVAF